MILNLGEWPRRAVLSYSGTYTTKTITVNGKSYTLYSFTGSGTLSVSGGKLKNADIWACGGGGSPALIKTARGGGGGYTAQLNGQTLPIGQYVITIGAAQAATSIARGGTALLTANGAPVLSGTSDANSGKGGSGGGMAAGGTAVCKGQGTTTRPFGDTVNFASLPCAGGGGACGRKSQGSYDDGSSAGDWYGYGGKGGSNGSDGGLGSVHNATDKPYGGAGGATGGGRGQTLGEGGAAAAVSTAATYYGSGGGGAHYTHNGHGYQGWLLIRVPA